MRIVQLTTVHAWNDVRIYHKICRTLARAGHDVHIIAPHPGSSEDPKPQSGVTCHWLPVTRSRIARLINALRAIGIVRRIRPDAVQFHDPELMTTGMILRLMGCHVIYDVHEYVPGSIMQREWVPKPLRPFVSLAVRAMGWLFSRFFCTAIVSVTPHIAQHFPRRRTIVVQNYPILDEFTFSSEPYPTPDKPVFVFIGGVSRDRGGVEMIQAAQRIDEVGRISRTEIVGPIVSRSFARELDDAAEGTSAVLVGPVAREEMARRLGVARASLVLYHPAPNHKNAQPNKLFEAMAAGVPVIASDFLLWRQIVDGCGCGLLVDPLDPASIADAMKWMIDHPEDADAMGRRGRDAVKNRYNWDRESQKLIDLYVVLSRGRFIP